MNLFQKCRVWYCKLTKRLVRQWSIVVLLCMIVAVVPFANYALSHNDSGVLHIVLCCADDDALAKKVQNRLLEDESIIHFSLSHSPRQAREMVVNHKADAAWIFAEGFSQKLELAASKKEIAPVVEIVERESNIALKVAKEKLFAAFYGEYAYSVYKNFVYTRIDSKLPEETVKEYYYSTQGTSGIIDIEKLDAHESEQSISINYLNAPVRGLLSLIVVLCSLTAALYYLKDRADGRFDRIPEKKRLPVAFAYCLSVVVPASIACLASILLSDFSTGLYNEVKTILFFVFSSALFGTVFCVVFRSPGKLGAAIPGVIMVLLALSPIFFNMKVLRPVRLMLPLHYYLYSIQNEKYIVYSIAYCLAMCGVLAVLNKFASFKSEKSII